MYKSLILFIFFATIHAVNQTTIQTMENEQQAQIEAKALKYVKKYNLDKLEESLDRAQLLLTLTQRKFQKLKERNYCYNREEYFSLLDRETGLKLILNGIERAIEINRECF